MAKKGLDAERLFFTSDTHFGHKNILKYAERPFASIEEHDRALIENWNAVVPRDGIVYHLGDFAFSRNPEAIFYRLNGSKHLIWGNHDRGLRGGAARDMWASAGEYREIRVAVTPAQNLQRIMLMHYPIESWNKRHHGAWHLHGHCHGSLPSPDWQKRVDVGVDVWNYRPVSFEQLAEHMAKKAFKPIDHHGRGHGRT